jgi:DNA repair protein SbcC/Rad50
LLQPARPLIDDVARLAADISNASLVLESSRQQAVQAQASQELAARQVQQATTSLQAQEIAQREAAPLLDQAKALDAGIAARLPAHEAGKTAAQAADQANDTAQASLLELQERQRSLHQEQETGTQWLDTHQHWAALAKSWPLWEQLFTQAGLAAAQADAADTNLAQAQQLLNLANTETTAAQDALTAASATLGRREEQRQTALAALQTIDGAVLQQQRSQLEAHGRTLDTAEKAWNELARKQQELIQWQAKAAQLAHAVQAEQAALSTEAARTPAIEAALLQAEKSLKNAEAACAASVEQLRANLAPDTPCPVCGALEHPYSHQDQVLQAMLASLQNDVQACRTQSHANIAQLATHKAALDGYAREQAPAAQVLAALPETIAQLSSQWQSHSATLLLPAEEARAGWFAEQLAANTAGLQALAQQEATLRQAQLQRDQAQTAHEQAAAEHVRLTAALSAVQTKLAQLQAQQAASQDKGDTARSALDGLLIQLDSAFTDTEGAEDWKEHWRQGPAAFRAAREIESEQWLKQQTAQQTRIQTQTTLTAQLEGLQTAAKQAQQLAKDAHSAFTQLDTQLKALQTERKTLWNGRPVAEVEQQLVAAIDTAKTTLAQQQTAALAASQEKTRLDEACAQAGQRLTSLQQQEQAAATALQDWLQQFQLAHSDHAPGDTDSLRERLSISADAMRTERAALQAIEHRHTAAVSVLAERRQQLAIHVELPPPELETDAAVLQTALDALTAERQQANQQATQLRLAIAQDDAKRHSAQAMLAQIEEQAAIERRWASLNELIGSADGKKFRNYAQQFTLEVLLGYANAHLNHLARRYQLERIDNPNNPSLGLMVRDQDMGGELRSVHSLSGGESFLVSLALALGLASLSSNRVRVESLFIDEGFGSLDTETLRVAMDALDGLQAMGRKVGVISHVQEMTERIATKILVRPGSGGKSVVTVQ